jgi:hypothetical protein
VPIVAGMVAVVKAPADLFHWCRYSFRASPRSRTVRRQHVVTWFTVYVCMASATVLAFQTYTAALVGFGLAAIFTVTTWRG